ncbi:MAG: T9SS type A sorting domain-containing protein [Muribaculaceae bacterium]|nr:T9SS type A sorting domain-containing protein [Muribaculaceae bacterium]
MKNYRLILSAVALMACFAFGQQRVSASPAGDDIEIAVDAAIEPTINVVGQQVEIEISDDSSHQLTVYALTGQIVKSETVELGRTLVDLPRGYYIVKVDKTAKRVIIK